MADLSCTCGPGESVAGTRQEIIEQRLAGLFGLTIPEVHALLDLLDRTLGAMLDIPYEQRPEDDSETERRMAAISGRTEGWVRNFLTSWDFISGQVEKETFVPWNGLFKAPEIR